MGRTIMPSITTIKSIWPDKIREIDVLGLEEVAIFPTTLNIADRQKLYVLLENSSVKRIPHVHLRHDCEAWELDYLIKRFDTKVFNLHPCIECLEFLEKNPKFRKVIYVENLADIDDMFMAVLEKCAGLCLDLAHWENHGYFFQRPSYQKFSAVVKNHEIGINHISAFGPSDDYFDDPATGERIRMYDQHMMSDIEQFTYVKKFLPYLADYASIEIENSLSEQIKVKEYLNKIGVN